MKFLSKLNIQFQAYQHSLSFEGGTEERKQSFTELVQAHNHFWFSCREANIYEEFLVR